MNMPPILYKGSVKNVRGITGKSPYVFEFSDRYSVFDWGAMPDELPNKGKSLAAMASLFFRFLADKESWKEWSEKAQIPQPLLSSETLASLKKSGLQHHNLGLVDENGEKLPEGEYSRFLAVRPISVIHPKKKEAKNGLSWDYSAYQDRPVDALVPLEVIFRFGLPEGSSLWKRIDNEKYRQELGLKAKPEKGEVFDIPLIEFSTKLESTDRYITLSEAKQIAGLTQKEARKLKETAIFLALRLKDLFAEFQITLWDGKFEFAFAPEEVNRDERDFMLVDSIGPDELRLTYQNVQLSKESLRKFYRSGPWYQAVEKAKNLAEGRGISDWKTVCEQELRMVPPKLNPELKVAASQMYQTLCEKMAKGLFDESLFPHSSELDDIVQQMNLSLGEQSE